MSVVEAAGILAFLTFGWFVISGIARAAERFPAFFTAPKAVRVLLRGGILVVAMYVIVLAIRG